MNCISAINKYSLRDLIDNVDFDSLNISEIYSLLNSCSKSIFEAKGLNRADTDDKNRLVRASEYIKDALQLLDSKADNWNLLVDLAMQSETDLHGYLENLAADKGYDSIVDYLYEMHGSPHQTIRDLVVSYCLYNAEYEFSQIS
jgi:hypothetical protein